MQDVDHQSLILLDVKHICRGSLGVEFDTIANGLGPLQQSLSLLLLFLLRLNSVAASL